ncbi:hypothetical protein GUJ93_ZPchr0002g25205 [Zizania palustris]|uniref:Up-frameshift suppressor 2 C-terminal domain-containing protein n=1 Tax=Zizania palustris TaxID=103762 RepID=A0A8J5VH55_ZIZPA|nr:hypothetical protein GUJ93_ZPchr0002g25205 [Zizania palustris]
MKKGHKQQTKQILIPSDCSLVQSSKQQEAAELEEKRSIKHRILEYNERDEEEMNGGSSHMGNWGQGGSNNGSSIRSVGRGSWDGLSRGGRQRHHIAEAHSARAFTGPICSRTSSPDPVGSLESRQLFSQSQALESTSVFRQLSFVSPIM